METWSWILAFPLLWTGLWLLYTGMGKRALSRYRSEPAEPLDEWAEYKRLAAEVRKRKLQERDDWQKQFQALVQATCKRHEYKGDRYHGWYACINCGHEQEWTYNGSCTCRTVWEQKITDVTPQAVLLSRSPSCPSHGRTPAKEAAAEGVRLYAKGGYRL